MTRRILSAADDLGLTEEGRSDYRRRVRLLFDEGCVMLGPEQASKLFREQARSQRKPGKGKRPPPPRKRKGAHDPEGDPQEADRLKDLAEKDRRTVSNFVRNLIADTLRAGNAKDHPHAA